MWPKNHTTASGLTGVRAQWHLFFDHYGIAPPRLSYEDAIANYPGYQDELLAMCGFAPIELPPARRLVKVGDAKNAEFARLLRHDAQAELCLRLPQPS